MYVILGYSGMNENHQFIAASGIQTQVLQDLSLTRRPLSHILQICCNCVDKSTSTVALQQLIAVPCVALEQRLLLLPSTTLQNCFLSAYWRWWQCFIVICLVVCSLPKWLENRWKLPTNTHNSYGNTNCRLEKNCDSVATGDDMTAVRASRASSVLRKTKVASGKSAKHRASEQLKFWVDGWLASTTVTGWPEGKRWRCGRRFLSSLCVCLTILKKFYKVEIQLSYSNAFCVGH